MLNGVFGRKKKPATFGFAQATQGNLPRMVEIVYDAQRMLCPVPVAAGNVADELDPTDQRSGQLLFLSQVEYEFAAHRVSSIKALPILVLEKLYAFFVCLDRDNSHLFRAKILAHAPPEARAQLERWINEYPAINNIQPKPNNIYSKHDAKLAAVSDAGLKLTTERRIANLRDYGPKEWHGVVLGYDWDVEPERILGWIAAQPNCDLASAIEILLAGQIGDLIEAKTANVSYDPERWRLFHGIVQRLAGPGYARHEEAISECWVSDAEDAIALRRTYERDGRCLPLAIPEAPLRQAMTRTFD